MAFQTSQSEFYNYPANFVPYTVYEVTGSPCTGPVTEKRILEDPGTGVLYTGPTTRYNGTFFMSPTKKSYYVVASNGIVSDPINNLCPAATPPLYWKDLGVPSSISKYGKTVLAAYGNLQIVVKFNFTNTRNPLGVIVAGEWLKVQRSVFDNDKYLNFPALVQWKSDGSKFAVYSAGNHKTVKVFTSAGSFIWGSDGGTYGGAPLSDWEYVVNSNGYSSSIASTVPSTHVMRRLEGSNSNVNDNWIPTKLQFPEGKSSNRDAVFIMVQRKANVSGNVVSIDREIHMCFSYMNVSRCYRTMSSSHPIPGASGSTQEARISSVDDLISDFVIGKVEHPDANRVRYQIIIVHPRDTTRTNYDRFKYAYVNTGVIELNWNTGNTTAVGSVISNSMRMLSQNRILDKNVRAYAWYIGGLLRVVAKNSSTSWWDNIMRYRDTFIASGSSMVLTVLAVIAQDSIGGVLIEVFRGGSAMLFQLGAFPVIGWITVAVLIGVVIFGFLLRKPPKAADTVSFSMSVGGSITAPVYTRSYGLLDPSNWADNQIEYSNIVFDSVSGNDWIYLQYDEDENRYPIAVQLHTISGFNSNTKTILSDKTIAL